MKHANEGWRSYCDDPPPLGALIQVHDGDAIRLEHASLSLFFSSKSAWVWYRLTGIAKMQLEGYSAASTSATERATR